MKISEKKNLDLETNIYLDHNFCIKNNGDTSFNAVFHQMYYVSVQQDVI